MKKTVILLSSLVILVGHSQSSESKEKNTQANPPVYIAFLWHMHQPIYWPYESISATQAASRYSFSVVDVHNQRVGPYTTWPRSAVQKGIDAGLENLGAQVSFSGSLIENLNILESSGNGNFTGWKSSWNFIKNQKTSLNNPRVDMVGFGYFHPLMGLIDELDIRKQIQFHKIIMAENFPGAYSKGMFPPENAFSERMIPALEKEGIEWVLVDNIHFDRSAINYPYSTSGNLYEPNKADQVNPDPKNWIALNNVWAPTKNSAQWGRQPHYAEYTDPATGTKSKIIVVPADRYLGNEDGRGGFGALQYESVMSQVESYNTDPAHPILIVLHHDGDNYGGGSDGYYNSNYSAFVDWLKANRPRFVCTTIQDYLQLFPPDSKDIIHVEDGAWAGADNGDPEFLKWLGNPGTDGYSPDRNSWGVITAAKNYVFTAHQIDSANTKTKEAWKYLLVGESSDYWYWDNSENGAWDSHSTRAANLAISAAQTVTGTDLTPPTIFLPQREPYNPGGTEWGINQGNDITVWSYVFDLSGLASVVLKYRTVNDGVDLASTSDYKTYAGGATVSAWIAVDMTAKNFVSKTNPVPLVKAKEYSASITGITDTYIDYYIEAVDNQNNSARSPIRHCWIGKNSSGGGTQRLSWNPTAPQKNDAIVIKVAEAKKGKLHWGVNDNGSVWTMPDSAYWPSGTFRYSSTDQSVETPFSLQADTTGNYVVTIGPFNNLKQIVERVAFVIHWDDNTWDNNGGNNYHIAIGGGDSTATSTFVMDGKLDTSAYRVAGNAIQNLFVGWDGSYLYVGTPSAPSDSSDTFIFVTDSLRTSITSPWGKNGKVVGSSLFLANESTNNYVAWNNAGTTAQKASGAFLEGTFNVQSQFGYIPSQLYIAVGRYGTADGGVLKNQIPAGNGDGNIDGSEYFAYRYRVVKVSEKIVGRKNSSFVLEQNYPNPFNPTTVINYEIPGNSRVTIKLYNVLGNEIRTLVDQDQTRGIHFIQLDARDIPSGVYFYTLRAGAYSASKKMIVMK